MQGIRASVGRERGSAAQETPGQSPRRRTRCASAARIRIPIPSPGPPALPVCGVVPRQRAPGGPARKQLLAAQPRQLPPSPSGLAGQTILIWKYEEDLGDARHAATHTVRRETKHGPPDVRPRPDAPASRHASQSRKTVDGGCSAKDTAAVLREPNARNATASSSSSSSSSPQTTIAASAAHGASHRQ